MFAHIIQGFTKYTIVLSLKMVHRSLIAFLSFVFQFVIKYEMFLESLQNISFPPSFCTSFVKNEPRTFPTTHFFRPTLDASHARKSCPDCEHYNERIPPPVKITKLLEAMGLSNTRFVRCEGIKFAGDMSRYSTYHARTLLLCPIQPAQV